jgi:hypothetical protein
MNKPECKIYANGDKEWWLNNKRHREDGPACEWANGDKSMVAKWKMAPRRWSGS